MVWKGYVSALAYFLTLSASQPSVSRPQPPPRSHRQKVGAVQVALGVYKQVRSLFTLLTASLSFWSWITSGACLVALGIDKQIRSLFNLPTASLSFHVRLQVLENIRGVEVALGVDEQVRDLFTPLNVKSSVR